MFLLLCELFFLFSEMEWVSFFAYALNSSFSNNPYALIK